MRHYKTISAATVAPSFLLISLLLGGQSWAQWNLPPTRTVEVSDTYFGKTYADPYRWLENTRDKEVEDWFKAQAIVTDNVLDKIPARNALAREWMGLDNYQASSCAPAARWTGLRAATRPHVFRPHDLGPHLRHGRLAKWRGLRPGGASRSGGRSDVRVRNLAFCAFESAELNFESPVHRT
jgi:hypothetical protein